MAFASSSTVEAQHPGISGHARHHHGSSHHHSGRVGGGVYGGGFGSTFPNDGGLGYGSGGFGYGGFGVGFGYSSYGIGGYGPGNAGYGGLGYSPTYGSSLGMSYPFYSTRPITNPRPSPEQTYLAPLTLYSAP